MKSFSHCHYLNYGSTVQVVLYGGIKPPRFWEHQEVEEIENISTEEQILRSISKNDSNGITSSTRH